MHNVDHNILCMYIMYMIKEHIIHSTEVYHE